jgi:hypothetical protein
MGAGIAPVVCMFQSVRSETFNNFAACRESISRPWSVGGCSPPNMAFCDVGSRATVLWLFSAMAMPMARFSAGARSSASELAAALSSVMTNCPLMVCMAASSLAVVVHSTGNR